MTSRSRSASKAVWQPNGLAWDWRKRSLIVIRAIHFAATAVTAGTLIFRVVVAEPALRSVGAAATVVRIQTLRVAWIGLATTVVSGAIWVLLQAVAMSGLSLSEAMTADVLLTVMLKRSLGWSRRSASHLQLFSQLVWPTTEPRGRVGLRWPRRSASSQRLRGPATQDQPWARLGYYI